MRYIAEAYSSSYYQPDDRTLGVKFVVIDTEALRPTRRVIARCIDRQAAEDITFAMNELHHNGEVTITHLYIDGNFVEYIVNARNQPRA